jgi:hypothetical protein
MSDDSIKMILAAIETTNAKLEQLRAEVAAHGVSMARLETEVRLRACPAPGACTELLARITAMEAKLRPIEDRMQQIKGAKWSAGAMITGVSLLTGALGAKLLHLFHLPK